MSRQARSIVEEALSHAEGLGQSHPTRILLLSTLADFWQQDRNLLKSLAYREKAAAAADAAPLAKSPVRGTEGQAYSNRSVVGFSGRNVASRLDPVPDKSLVYPRLADLYQQIGRPDAAAAVLAKVRTLATNDDAALASIYERQGQIDEAAAIYRKQAEQAAAHPQSQPWQLAGPLQSLAGLYQREQRYGEAAAALQQAIAVLDASGKLEAHNETISIRQNLASILSPFSCETLRDGRHAITANADNTPSRPVRPRLSPAWSRRPRCTSRRPSSSRFRHSSLLLSIKACHSSVCMPHLLYLFLRNRMVRAAYWRL